MSIGSVRSHEPFTVMLTPEEQPYAGTSGHFNSAGDSCPTFGFRRVNDRTYCSPANMTLDIGAGELDVVAEVFPVPRSIISSESSRTEATRTISFPIFKWHPAKINAFSAERILILVSVLDMLYDMLTKVLCTRITGTFALCAIATVLACARLTVRLFPVIATTPIISFPT